VGRTFGELVGPLRNPARVVLALALLGLIGFAAYAVGRNLWADQQLRAARRALAANDLPRARACLLLSLRVYRHNPDIHFLLARAARRAGDYDEAAYHREECRRLGGLEDAVELERVLADAQRGRLAEAEKYLRVCLDQEHPEAVWILEALAQGYVQTYRLPPAMLCLNRWLRLQPDSVPALFLRAQASEHLQYAAEARQDYQRVLDLDPDHEAARFSLADSLAQAERSSDALPHFRLLRERRPGDPAVLLGLARCLVDQGNHDEARGLLEAVLAEDPRQPVGMIQLGKVALAQGKLDEARRWLEKAVKQVPYDREAVHTLAQCYQQMDRPADARSCQERLKAIAADREVLREAVRQMLVRPHDPLPRLLAGQVFLKAGNANEALRWFESALQEDPGHVPTHQALRDYYLQAGLPDRAAAHERKLQGEKGP
jgi:tetratricopeptide (TPR) repeat protein